MPLSFRALTYNLPLNYTRAMYLMLARHFSTVFILKIYFNFVCMLFFIHMFGWVLCVTSAIRGQEKALDSLALRLQMVVSLTLGAYN